MEGARGMEMTLERGRERDERGGVNHRSGDGGVNGNFE